MALANMLNSSEPGPTAGPLSALLPPPGPMPQSNPFTSILTSPWGNALAGLRVAPLGGTLGSSMGQPSTGPLTPSSALAGLRVAPPGGTLGSSMGQPSTGPLTPGSTLMAPVTGTVAVSLSSPLPTSTAAPLGVSQNLLANPMSNLVLSEAPRAQLTEPFGGCPSGLHPSAGAGPAGATKVPMSPEHPQPQPPQDLEAVRVTFVGAPMHSSTPVGTTGPSGPVTAFSYSTSDAETQPSAPQGQAVPASAPVTRTAAPTDTGLVPAPPPVPQATKDYTPPSTTHVTQGPPPSPIRTQHSPTQPPPTTHSPPRNPHSPPRTVSSPASVSDPRGPRGIETPRKSIVDLERKLAHRKSNKFSDGPGESRQLAWERLVGEIAFQLDRRILSSIFPERVRLYGFTVSNIPEKIIQASLKPSDHKLDEELCQTLTQRYVSIMNRLQGLGYNGRVHPALTEQLVNAYGILRERPELASAEGGSYSVDFLQRVLVETVHPSMLTDALLLLSCLNQLAHDDGRPMFIW
ncbi:speriolin isoform X2 [Suricata suricatta]|nr:speriolin isoform X2 [Suricata suricatta]